MWKSRPGTLYQDAAGQQQELSKHLINCFYHHHLPHPHRKPHRMILLCVGVGWKGKWGRVWQEEAELPGLRILWKILSLCHYVFGSGNFFLPELITDKVANCKDARFLGSVSGWLPFIKRKEDFHGDITLERLHRNSSSFHVRLGKRKWACRFEWSLNPDRSQGSPLGRRRE